ncbi:MAG: hypothetical protein J6Y54_09590 [Lentisphaeria bacterium]|nr:hypothetical protein [Lentisphaeria bacterium]
MEASLDKLERGSLENRIKDLNDMIAAVEAVEAKIDATPETQALFDDALLSGKLTDRANTPEAVKRSCVRLNAELRAALDKAQRELARAKKFAGIAPARQKKPEPKPEKNVEKPAEEKPKQKAEPPKPAPEPKAQNPKKLANPDDPRTLWKKAEPLYAKKEAKQKISVTVALGDVKREDIEIRLSTDNKDRHPGDGLEFWDKYGNSVVIKTGYDESTGVLTITGGENMSQLLMNERISVVAGGKEYPLFFKAGFSRPDGEIRLEFPGKGIVSLLIKEAQLPKKFFRKNSQMIPTRYDLKCGDKEYRLTSSNGTLQFEDRKLSELGKREAKLKKLKAQVEKEPENYIFKIGSDDLEKYGVLKKGSNNKTWEALRDHYESLLHRANAVKKKLEIEQITSLRKFHDGLTEDDKKTWGKKRYGLWESDYNEFYKKWEKASGRFSRELIEKVPMNLWSDRGTQTLTAELKAIRKDVKTRQEELRGERYFLVISETGGKIEIELDVK